jgi:thymidylate synthase (FAD)
MILVKPSHQIIKIMGSWDISALQLIEIAGRTCYKSEERITRGSSERFVKMLKNSGHESVLEHSAMTVRFICDRGVSHELVRHRLCSFSQESTRYCNYLKKGIAIIHPEQLTEAQCKRREEHFKLTQELYEAELLEGQLPQIARGVLPTALKTEIIVTANFREWKHIFNLRCSIEAHPQMRELMVPLRDEMIEKFPELFA